MALCAQHDPRPAAEGVRFLLRHQRADGSIPSVSDSIGPRPFIFHVPLLGDIFALMALGHVRNRIGGAERGNPPRPLQASRTQWPPSLCSGLRVAVAGGGTVDMGDAFVVPGRMFGPGAGMLMYVDAVAERRGARVHRHAWSQEPPPGFDAQLERWVRGEILESVAALGGRPLLIGKSLGTFAAAVAAERSLPAVWLTPLLTAPPVVAALRRAEAPILLVGGTSDSFWDGALARRLTPHVVEAEVADHGMLVPGPLAESIAVLARLVTAVDEFREAIDWAG